MTSPLVLLPKTAVAVNCCVLVGRIHALVGDKEREVISSDEGKNPLQLPNRISAENAAARLAKDVTRRILPFPLPKLNLAAMQAMLCPLLRLQKSASTPQQ